MQEHDTAVIGGGLVGLATALALTEHGREVVVLEAESQVAAHQSGHNSGVIHAGLYYRPGSLKARLCTAGREAMYEFCRHHGVAHERCGKVVVATSEQELGRLDDLEQRGRANGLDLQRLDAAGVREHEPHAAGRAGLFVPVTGVADFAGVARVLAGELAQRGPGVRTGCRLVAVREDGDGLALETTGGPVRCRAMVCCAGLQADRVARLCGHRPTCRIIPIRGEYWQLSEEAARLVRHLIYPVPDPALPFLGVHLTRCADGAVEAGPSAVLTFNRHGYQPWRPNLRDALELLSWPGSWRMFRRNWRTGADQLYHSISRAASARSLQRLVPEIQARDLRPGPAGVRAMAVDPDGSMVDDFRIERQQRIVHVLNAPSPAATACLAIGRYIADLVSDGTRA